MTRNHEGTPESALSRRHLISAAGLAALGLATSSEAATANADGGDPNNDAAGNPIDLNTGQVSARSVPALTAGYSYFTGNQFAFHSNSNAPTDIRRISSGAYSLFNYVVCPLHIPAGTRVREVTIFGTAGAVPTPVYLREYPLDDVGASAAVVTVTLPVPSTAAAPVTAACDFTIDASRSYDLEVYSADANNKIFAFRIGMQPAAAFVPITPYRAYDSRNAAVPNPGVIAPNTSRVVNIVNAISEAGTIITPNVIPSTARAITYNLTATLTTGDNYLAVTPGLAPSTTVSAINFAANRTVANAATVSLDNGNIKVFCGGGTGSTHFIIDVTGYYI